MPTDIVSAVRSRPWLREIAIFAAALLAYQGSRAIVVGDWSAAHANALSVIELEKGAGLFFEGAVQGALLGHTFALQGLNQLYLWAHWTITPLFFIWLHRTRPGAYRPVRNGFLLANALALVAFVVFPVAPPRLVPEVASSTPCTA